MADSGGHFARTYTTEEQEACAVNASAKSHLLHIHHSTFVSFESPAFDDTP